MKKKKLSFLAGMIVLALIIGSVAVYSATQSRVIQATYPAHRANEICLVNADMEEYIDRKQLTNADGTRYVDKYVVIRDGMRIDNYEPVPVTLTFKCSSPAQYYNVQIATDKSFTNAKKYVSDTESVTVKDLYTGTTYYWQVTAQYADRAVKSGIFTFTTKATPRTIYADGAKNTRDIGGWKTDSGGRIKQGMVYRGGAVNALSAQGIKDMLYTYGIKTEIELREASNANASLLKGHVVQITNTDMFPYYINSAAPINAEAQKRVVNSVMSVFADPGSYPVYFHCTIGRDRTGTAAMLLEGLLGVSEEDIIREYELFVFSSTGTDISNPDEMHGLLVDTMTWLKTTYSTDGSFKSAVEKYLLDTGMSAESFAAIRQNLIEQ